MPNISQPSVRRTLFHQTLSRRPAASTGPPNSLSANTNLSTTTGSSIGIQPSNNNTTNTLSTRSSHHRLKPTSSETSRPIKPTENREIVVRDKNGGYKLDVLSLPHGILGGDGEELGGLEAEEEGGEAALDVELNGRDKEKFEAALVEMVIRHRNRQSSGEPDEILNIVHQSLRKKVASLDDDNWMFEPERDVRF